MSIRETAYPKGKSCSYKDKPFRLVHGRWWRIKAHFGLLPRVLGEVLAHEDALVGGRVHLPMEHAALLEPQAAVLHAHEHLDVGPEGGPLVGRYEWFWRGAAEHGQVVGLGPLRKTLLPFPDGLKAHFYYGIWERPNSDGKGVTSCAESLSFSRSSLHVLKFYRYLFR